MIDIPAALERVRLLVAADHGLAVVSVTRADGSVHSSIVNGGVVDHPVTAAPVVAFVVRGDALKLRFLRARPHVTVAFRAGWEWAAVEGAVDLAGPDDPRPGLDPADIPRVLRDIFTAAGGTHDDWDTYDRVMAQERRTAVLVHPLRIYGR